MTSMSLALRLCKQHTQTASNKACSNRCKSSWMCGENLMGKVSEKGGEHKGSKASSQVRCLIPLVNT